MCPVLYFIERRDQTQGLILKKTEDYFTFLLNKSNFLQKSFWSQLVFCLMGLNSTKTKIVAITLLCGLP